MNTKTIATFALLLLLFALVIMIASPPAQANLMTTKAVSAATYTQIGSSDDKGIAPAVGPAYPSYFATPYAYSMNVRANDGAAATIVGRLHDSSAKERKHTAITVNYRYAGNDNTPANERAVIPTARNGTIFIGQNVGLNRDQSSVTGYGKEAAHLAPELAVSGLRNLAY